MNAPAGTGPVVRPARPDDAEAIRRLVAAYAERKILLPRSSEEILGRISRALVADAAGEVAGCVFVEVFGDGLCEIRSLAVDERLQGRGLGRALVDGAIGLCRDLGVKRVFVLTYAGRFFRRFGFRPVSKGIFPQKVWGDCIRCPHYYHCDEDALLLDLDDPPAADAP